MKFLCDVHISFKLAKHVASLGFECEHVNNISEGSRTKDRDIARFVDENKLVLITKDRDFKNSFLLSQTPSRFIKINLGNLSDSVLMDVFEINIDKINQLYSSANLFMVEIEVDCELMVTK